MPRLPIRIHGPATPALLLAAILFLLPATRALAQDLGAPPHPAGHGAPRDSSHFLPTWLHPVLEFGGGWMSGPSALKSHYESGQGFAVGLEGRTRNRWSMRTSADYQMLIARDFSSVTILSPGPLPGTVVLDTTQIETRTTGWIASVRQEAGVRLVDGIWLTGGLGGGYMHSGLTGDQTDLNSGFNVSTSGAVGNGWGWLWTAAMRYDFTPDPRLPLSLDVRTSSLQREHFDLRSWSIRVGFRIPPSAPRGADGRRHRR